MAEPKNKSSESFEHDYYCNNMRQEIRGNAIPFCKSQIFVLKMVCSREYGHKVRMQFGKREANRGLHQCLNSKRIDWVLELETSWVFCFNIFMARFALVGPLFCDLDC